MSLTATRAESTDRVADCVISGDCIEGCARSAIAFRAALSPRPELGQVEVRRERAAKTEAKTED